VPVLVAVICQKLPIPKGVPLEPILPIKEPIGESSETKTPGVGGGNEARPSGDDQDVRVLDDPEPSP